MYSWTRGPVDGQHIGTRYRHTRQIELPDVVTPPRAEVDPVGLPKRSARWVFQSPGTLRQRLIHRVGRFLWPQGQLPLRIAEDAEVQKEMEGYLQALREAA